MVAGEQSRVEVPLRNWNWLLVFAGIGMIIVEVLLGAATGFDFALVGACLVLGGGAGLLFGSVKLGLATTAALAFIYIAFFRRYIRSKVTAAGKPSNVDAILGRTAVVTEPIAPHKPGQVRVGDELWRAALADGVTETRSAGESVRVETVDGVTLLVR
jgi:membrane-bound serine protease (ClpP class)